MTQGAAIAISISPCVVAAFASAEAAGAYGNAVHHSLKQPFTRFVV